MSPVLCLRHRSYWLASCDECRAARRSTLLASVQSCTVHATAHVLDQRICVENPPAPVGRVRRTYP